MREVTVERVVDASRPMVERALTPETVVTHEGSFTVQSVEETDGGTLVTASGGGLTLTYRFEPREDGVYYTQADDAGPFERMETWLSVDPAADGGGVRLRARSLVELRITVPFADRVAAWKRTKELERLLDGLAADLG